MPSLTTQTSVRQAQELMFCYLCGDQFTNEAENHPDHVPPQSVFALPDRNFPLKVASHEGCNKAESPSDEVLGQLIAVIHHKHPEPKNAKLDLQVFEVRSSGETFLGVIGTDLKRQIARWVRGFHAALYQEFLPEQTLFAIHPPFPCGEVDQGGLSIEKVRVQHPLFVRLIKTNRLADRLDRIVCNNGKCVYECVWVLMDHGRWACVFALQIYDWVKLGDSTHFPRRGCVGWYQPKAGRPRAGTKYTRLIYPISNIHRLDPFGD